MAAKEAGIKEKQIRRRTGVINQCINSEYLFFLLKGNTGSYLNNAMYRLGELFIFAQQRRDKEIIADINKWYRDQVLSFITNEIKELKADIDVITDRDNSELSFDSFKKPNMFFEFDVIHNSYPKLINLICQLDALTEELEINSLLGVATDEEFHHLKNRIYNVIGHAGKLIFKVTQPGKRNGGSYNVSYFYDQLKNGVFSFYPEQPSENQSQTNAEEKQVNPQIDEITIQSDPAELKQAISTDDVLIIPEINNAELPKENNVITQGAV